MRDIEQRQQQQQGFLGSVIHLNDNSNNNHIAYRNFVHSIKSPRTRAEYNKSLRSYMNWLSVYDYNTILQKDPKLIASDIIEYVIYLQDEKKLAPATVNTDWGTASFL